MTLLDKGLTWERASEGTAAEVTVEAPATELLLILNRRRVADDDQVSGDVELFDRWRELSRF